MRHGGGRIRWRWQMAAVLSICLVASTGAVLGSEDAVVPASFCRGLFLVPLEVADGVSLEMLVDTGSSWTFIDPGSARRAFGRADYRLTLQTARLAGVDLGPVKVRSLPLSELGMAVGRPIDGILGFPAFRRVLLTLDYARRQVRLGADTLPPGAGMGIVQYEGRQRPHLPTRVAERRLRLLLDSGSTGSFVLPPDDDYRWEVEPRPLAAAVLANGIRLDDVGRLDQELRLGPLVYDRPVARVARREPLAGALAFTGLVLTFDQASRRLRILRDEFGPIRLGPKTGTGVAYRPRADALEVVHVDPGSPADLAGLLPGDLVVAVDERPAVDRGCVEQGLDAGIRRLEVSRAGVRRTVTVENAVLIP